MNRHLIVLFVTIICGISACQQSDKSSTMSPEKLTVAIPKNMASTLVKIADARGFFRDEGVDATLQLHSFGKVALQSLLDGNAELAAAADTPIAFAIVEGAKLSLLTSIVTSSRDNAILARKDRGVVTVSDLKGRRIGVPLGTSADFFLDSYLILNAIQRKDVVIVNMKPDEMTEALMKGKIDAVSIWNPLLASLQKKLSERGIMLHSNVAYTATYDIVSMQALTRQRPEAIRRFLRALVKAESFVAANPGESQRIMSEFTETDSVLLANIWNGYQFNLSLNQSLLVTLENEVRWAIKGGITARRDLPNFLESLYFDGLNSVKPDAVQVIR